MIGSRKDLSSFGNIGLELLVSLNVFDSRPFFYIPFFRFKSNAGIVLPRPVTGSRPAATTSSLASMARIKCVSTKS